MRLLDVALTTTCCTLVLLWWYAIHPQWFRDCPGPVLKPSPRPEPWCVSFNKKLNKEVAIADAGKVSLIAAGASAMLHGCPEVPLAQQHLNVCCHAVFALSWQCGQLQWLCARPEQWCGCKVRSNVLSRGTSLYSMVTALQRHGEGQIWAAPAPDALASQPSSIDTLAPSTTLKCWQWEVTSTPPWDLICA